MKVLKSAAIVTALTVAVGLAAAFAPAVHGQPRAAVAPRGWVGLAGGGSHIGVSVRDVEENDVKAGKLSSQGGVVVEDVTSDSPAEKAGVKRGDVVLEYDGEHVRGVRQFRRLVEETPSGRKVPVSLVRDGQRVSVTIEPSDRDAFSLLGDMDGVSALRDMARTRVPAVPPVPPAPRTAPFPPAVPVPPMDGLFPDMDGFVWRAGGGLGMTVSGLSSQLAEYFGTKNGVLVTSVSDQSAAAKAGLRAGDVITSFNGREVVNPGGLRQRIQRLDDGDEFTITVVRDKKATTLKGSVEAPRNRRSFRTAI